MSTGEPAPSQASRRLYAPAIWLFAVLLGGIWVYEHFVPDKWLTGDGSFYLNVAHGLVEHGSLRQEAHHPRSWYELDLGWNHDLDAAFSNIALGRNGQWWPKHPFLMPLCAAPFVWALGPLGALVFHFLCYSCIGVLCFRIATRVAPARAALLASAIFVATPWVYGRALSFDNDVFCTLLVLWAVDAALSGKVVLAGFMFGLGVFAKATNVLYGPALLGLFLLRRDFRGAARMAAAAAVPLLVYASVNAYLFGSPFTTSYDRILVREQGLPAMHSHRADFDFGWLALRTGLARVLGGPAGIREHCPWFFVALLGLVPLARQRWREALTLAWCMFVPLWFHAPYAWYRLEFNLPQLALAVAPLAALLPPWSGPSAAAQAEDSGGPRLRSPTTALLTLVLVGLLVAGFGRRNLATSGEYLWEHLPEAQVFLGELPCDYYNHQLQRWECSHVDTEALMSGRQLGTPMAYAGKPGELLSFHPHPSGQERRLEYGAVPMRRRLVLRYGLADTTKPGALVHFEVRIDGRVVLALDVRAQGLREHAIDTAEWNGRQARVVLSVRSESAEGCHFDVNGSPMD